MTTNSWINFIKTFYANERSKDKSKCRHRVNISQVAKVYNCKKRASTRKIKNKENFSQINPMFKGKHRKTVSKR